MLGKKTKGEPATFSIVERLTGHYLTFKIDAKTTDGVAVAMEQLRQLFGEKYSEIFRNITTDNGSEFAAFFQCEQLGCAVYFAHSYFAWERPVNERSNRLLRKFISKGASMKGFSKEEVLVLRRDQCHTEKKVSLPNPGGAIRGLSRPDVPDHGLLILYSDKVFNLILQFTALFQLYNY